MKIYLASRSPRRRQLLEQIAIPYETIEIAIDESWDGCEPVGIYTQRMAVGKAQAAARAKPGHRLPILAADTSVAIDNRILGKADTAADAIRMLKALSGKTHQVYTAVTVLTDVEKTRLNVSRVHMQALNDDEILGYCETGEPLGKAGGYAIQGRAAAFIEHLEGSYSGVMGLPLYEVAALLNESGELTAD